MKRVADIAWAAGFFDGEGTVFVCHQKRVPHRDRLNPARYDITYPVISVSQVEPHPIFRFARTVGGRRPGGPYKPRHKNSSPYYRWDACGRPSVRKILVLLWPYLSTPKKAQAHRAWRELERCKGKKSPILIPLPKL